MIDAKELRYGVSRWLEAGIITGDQVARILAFENAVDCAPPTREPSTHTSLVQLFTDVRAFVRSHPGATVLPADNPVTRELGWVAFKTEGEHEHSETFTIAVTRIKAALAELAPDDPLHTEILKHEGRCRIAARLARDESPTGV